MFTPFFNERAMCSLEKLHLKITIIISIHYCIMLNNSDILSGAVDICNCKSSAIEWCVTECRSIMVDKGLMYMEKNK